jgi:hypothetical protein
VLSEAFEFDGVVVYLRPSINIAAAAMCVPRAQPLCVKTTP